MTIPEPLGGEDRPSRRTGIVALMTAIVIVVAVLAWWMTGRETADGAPQLPVTREIPPDAMAPEGVRVRVKVLNATATRGLARRVANQVRDLGFDVVDYDNAPAQSVVSVITANTGNRDWAERLSRGLGIDSIVIAEDPSAFTDLTVVIGSAWQAPPPRSFRP